MLLTWDQVLKCAALETAAVDTYLFPALTTGCGLDSTRCVFLYLCIHLLAYDFDLFLSLSSTASVVSFSYSFYDSLIFPEMLSFPSCVRV